MGFKKQGKNNESQQRAIKSSSTRMSALQEMRARVECAIMTSHLQDKQNEHQDLKNISLWGVPLLPSTGHGGTDAVLQKFLKARGYKVEEALEMLENTLEWRRQHKADQILEEESVIEKGGPMQQGCRDKEGHPLIFFGVSTETENEEELLRWRVRYLEKAIKELKFDSCGGDGGQSLVQITDFNNSMSSLTIKSWQLLHQHYPYLIHRKILINVPLWYYASHLVSSRVRGSKEQPKIVVARPSRETKTLLKFISAENLPVAYGGLRRENDEEFCQDDKASELVVKEDGRGLIRVPVKLVGATLLWEVTVVGWDVLYKEEFVPQDEGSYKVLLREEQKNNTRKKKSGGGTGSTDNNNIIRNCFYIREAGHILITVDNDTMKKKKVFYRCKTKNKEQIDPVVVTTC